MKWLLISVAMVALGACAQDSGHSAIARPAPSVASPIPAGCSSTNGLPDPRCTPGDVNPDVTQANIHSTICMKGWTSTVRPPLTWSEPMKYKLMRAYGYYAGKSARPYELDHLIPLELGGSPQATANLWPETPATPNPKDGVESAANRAVCSGQMTLVDAQAQIARNWKKLAAALHVTTPAGARTRTR